MPSGAKKRKAAKKTKETQLPYSTAHGEEDLKLNDDRESEGGEISSPAYPFMGGEEEDVDKGNGEAKLSAVYESFTVSEDLMGGELGKEDNEAIQTSHCNAIEDSDAKCSATQENGYKLNVSSGAPKLDANMGSDPVQDSDNQPQMGLSLQPVQTSSWKSCCGLFELFAGSGSR